MCGDREERDFIPLPHAREPLGLPKWQASLSDAERGVTPCPLRFST